MSQMLVRPEHQSPVNEIPAVLATPELVSRADQIAVAIPALLVYSTGIELLIICRYQEGRTAPGGADPQEVARRATEQARQTADQVPRLITVNTRPVEMLGGHSDAVHGWTYRAWSRFEPRAAGADLLVGLSWPGVPSATISVGAPRLADAVRRVVTLWPI